MSQGFVQDPSTILSNQNIVGNIIQTKYTWDNTFITDSVGFSSLGTYGNIPTPDEGREVMSLAITPQDKNNYLTLYVMIQARMSVTTADVAVVIYRDAGNGFIWQMMGNNNMRVTQTVVLWRGKAGTTASTIFKTRMGQFNGSGQSWEYNGNGGNPVHTLFGSCMFLMETTT